MYLTGLEKLCGIALKEKETQLFQNRLCASEK
jgi:hypothetical protein